MKILADIKMSIGSKVENLILPLRAANAVGSCICTISTKTSLSSDVNNLS